MTGAIIAFLAFQAFFVLIGMSSGLVREKNRGDYLVAGRSIPAVLVALGAASANSSGFMFTGLVAATYREGLSSAWLMVGWISGDYLAWHVVHRRLRERSAEAGASSFSSFLALGNGARLRGVGAVAAVLTLMFLGTYAAAQLTAGTKAIQLLFGWPHWSGSILGAMMIALYCFAGGLRASIWANTAQAVVMMLAALVLLAVGLHHTHGISGLWARLREIDPQLVNWQPRNLRFGFLAFVVSWIAAGVGVVGQPHLMTVAMSIRSGQEIASARPIYFVYYVIFSAACILIGLCCRVLLTGSAGSGWDDEMALMQLSRELLPSVLVGLMLAGLFAAGIGGADTQLLCCTAALSEEIFPQLGQTYRGIKAIMLGTTVVALVIAEFGSDSVFELVVLSWSTLASSFGPLVVIQAFRSPVTDRQGVAMMLGGLATALCWRYGLKLSTDVYEVLPGMAAGFAIYGSMRCLGRIGSSLSGSRACEELR